MKIVFTHNTLCRYKETPVAVCKKSSPPEKCKRCKAGCTVYQMYMNSHEVCQALQYQIESEVEK